MAVTSTRLRFISSPSPEGLEVSIQMLPFKVEIKAILRSGADWYCWFILPDSIPNKDLARAVDAVDQGETSDLDVPNK